MARVDELRLMAKVARMYYVQELNQQAITEKLQLHQSTISRMLKKARTLNLVRFSIATPPGTFAELEDQLTSRFDLKDAVVVDCPAEGEAMVRDLGAALAYFLESTLKQGKIVGISSWSRSLFAMVDALHPGDYCANGKVVQILGGVGNVGSEFQAIHLAQRLAASIGAKPVLLQSPAVVRSAEAQRVLAKDTAVQEASDLFEKLDVALVGIGSMDPSRMLAASGNIFSRDERAELQRLGAVGDICFRYFDGDGQPIRSPLMKRVIGIDLVNLRACKRVVGVAGGAQKVQAILGALRGNLIDVLITDQRTAQALASAQR
ncbi:MAG TPA: sugar-binding transcriptional regulator [Terracidiphilus sp.]|nr:sugar-binding transcriptional regulator [Terracidiphilus sp.]